MTKGKEFISNLKLYSDYLKWDDELNRYENWEEACNKVLNTHLVKYGDKIKPYLDEIRKSYYNKEFLSSQRNLQFRGESIFRNNAKIYNCVTTYAYSPDLFNKGFFVLLSGCGLGVSLKKKYVSQLPKLDKRTGEAKLFVIPDSIEGWAEAIKVLISSYCKHPSLYNEYYGYQIKFDYSEIRPKGAHIFGGFRAPGHEGLKQSIEKIEKLIDNNININDYCDFKSIIVYDILMHISDAVLSGGIRRAAMNVLIDEDDEEIMKAKTGNWRVEQPQRARSNNSVALTKGKFTKEKLNEFISYNNGDNDIGFVFTNHEDEIFNPCFTINQRVLTDKGWRTFEQLLEMQNNGEEIIIKQDNRVKGKLVDGKEEWDFDYNKKGLTKNIVTKVAKTGENKEIFKLKTSYGREVEATGDHHFATKRGMVKLCDLTTDDEILTGIDNNIPTYDKYSDSYKIGYSEGLKYDELYKNNLLDLMYNKDIQFKLGFIHSLFNLIKFEDSLFNVITNKIIIKNKREVNDLILLVQELGMGSKVELLENGLYLFSLCNLSCEYDTYSKVESIEYLRNDDVYCLEENENRTLIVEGLTARRCFEIGFNFYDKIKDKTETVYDFCNLSEINASACCDSKGNFSEAKFYELCRNASIIGTLQAGYTSFPYIGKQTEDIVAGEALIGVSITGWMTRPELFNPEILKRGAEIVKQSNSEVAKVIGINEAARTTTVKPSGNSATILSTASGIHPEHSKRYFRIMQLNKDSETAKYLEKNNPNILEESKWSATNSDYVVYSPCENPDGTLYKNDMQGVKHLELIELVQKYWVENGKREELCYNPLTTHNVSNTVIIDNIDEITDYIFEHQQNFAAVSFISLFGDKDYVQAPFTSVLDSKELLDTYGDGVMFMSGLIVDGLHYFDDDLWTAVSYVLDINKKLVGDRDQCLLKKDWIRRVKKFAKNYFKGDINKTIYCMKDVHLYHKWKIINREFKLINFSEILTKPKFEEISKYGAISCSGGSCEIQF